MEAREKLGRLKPTNVGQASRVSGITPADIAVLVMYLKSSETGHSGVPTPDMGAKL
jgi:tRNA uridine 5-carboxymethylaminomethyl modification enzyme